MILKKVPVCITFILIFLFFEGCSKKDANSLPVINADNNKSVGASAASLLTASSFTSLKIEIQFMPGFQPDAASINNITSFLTTLINKPGGISVTQQQITAGRKDSYSIKDIATIEQENRKYFNSQSEVAVYVLITDGIYSEPDVLGVAYRNTSICLFGKKILDNSGGVGQASRIKLETTVAEHEFGHLLGLVDLGTTMQTSHKDAVHGSHCNVQSCLMYYASETTDLLGFLITGNIPSLDSQCLADIQANGGK
jgi:hypothetical protein